MKFFARKARVVPAARTHGPVARSRRYGGPTPLALALALALALSACSADDRTPLVVYSPHGRELLQDFERLFEERYPDVDVQWIDMGSQEVLDRLSSERANPQADVWFGAPATMFQAAADDGLLEAYTPEWAAALPAEARHAAGLWHGTYITPEVIAYNTEAVSPDEVPTDWDEILDPRWQGPVLIRHKELC